tara:strand:- start:173228 stop:174199 length:972 start_codon:yes stop_codon:yes gene_type:complete
MIKRTICLTLLSLSMISFETSAAEPETLRVLFVGNSYTGRHNLSKVVESMAEAGQPGLDVEVTAVIYGGRRLVDHWRLGTQNIVSQYRVSPDQVKATIAKLKQTVEKTPEDKHASAGIKRQQDFLDHLDSTRHRWDAVVLQSYRDDLEGDDSLYVQYAPKFAELAHEQGAKVILYETTPGTQNKDPITQAPDAAETKAKAEVIARLANRLNASVAPMSLVALRCQTERPDLTLRFENDAHLNHTMAYMSACAIYSALLDRSPVGLPVDSITDIRFFKDSERDKDRDGEPITRTFSAVDRADLQRIVWQSSQEFQQLRSKLANE